MEARLLKELKNKYQEGGFWDDWKERGDNYFGPSEARKAYDLLRAQGVIPPEGEFNFLSPSANIASHERCIFERDRECSPDRARHFVCTDLCESIVKKVQFTLSEEGFEYYAANVFEQKHPKGYFDVIWDRRGALWHSEPASRKVLMKKYYEWLKQGGSIVIDSDHKFNGKVRLRGFELCTAEVMLFAINRSLDISESVPVPEYFNDIVSGFSKVESIGSGKNAMMVIRK